MTKNVPAGPNTSNINPANKSPNTILKFRPPLTSAMALGISCWGTLSPARAWAVGISNILEIPVRHTIKKRCQSSRASASNNATNTRESMAATNCMELTNSFLDTLSAIAPEKTDKKQNISLVAVMPPPRRSAHLEPLDNSSTNQIATNCSVKFANPVKKIEFHMQK